MLHHHNSDTAAIKDHHSMLRRHDGSAFPVKINAARVDYKMVPAVTFLVRDNSKSIEAENELQRPASLNRLPPFPVGLLMITTTC